MFVILLVLMDISNICHCFAASKASPPRIKSLHDEFDDWSATSLVSLQRWPRMQESPAGLAKRSPPQGQLTRKIHQGGSKLGPKLFCYLLPSSAYPGYVGKGDFHES